MRKEYKYTDWVCNQFDAEIFNKFCKRIEKLIPDVQKESLLEDVDGSLYQTYHHEKGDIFVICSYSVNEVYFESDFDLDPYFKSA